PYYNFEGKGILSKMTDEKGIRSICLALVSSDFRVNDKVDVEIRGDKAKGIIVPFHLRSDAPPYARPILKKPAVEKKAKIEPKNLSDKTAYMRRAEELLAKSIENTEWRQKECINLIPSEQTTSPATRLLSVMDPAFRYAEHKEMKAFSNMEVFYYQGIDFIKEVEELLKKEFCAFLKCREVETRLISGQLANMTAFSSVLDYVNRADRRSEPRRIRCVMNNHVSKGGHISAQSMGGLHDFVAHDPRTEKPNVIGFPVRPENHYKIDVEASKKLIAEHKPELIIFGKSMVLHPEPVRAIKSFVREISLDCVVMYDMAHVLGLVGPLFQEPFEEGADIVTGSTHKTFFGTQRGIVAADFRKKNVMYKLWEAVKRRAFPGYLSNHHLGTMLGLLMSCYEMNYFRKEYQSKVLSNAKTFAKSLKDAGMDVAGDPEISYTETHQVIVNVGHGKGPEVARKLEENNIIVNYQATPDEEGFTAAGSLRLGVSEMTRFGMGREEFETAAQFIRDVVKGNQVVKDKVKSFRKNYLELKFCFSGKEIDTAVEKLHKLI
ncbi:MAG TPA: aminotransferase class I/II-fold pyridoxal phosphate-dependent enzyme, partial [bacterium]|nr:aminotransferase class I/II-fold pyridoxal phosphate-dependent enzyme [bacterium]